MTIKALDGYYMNDCNYASYWLIIKMLKAIKMFINYIINYLFTNKLHEQTCENCKDT